jgi:hypothetical protein
MYSEVPRPGPSLLCGGTEPGAERNRRGEDVDLEPWDSPGQDVVSMPKASAAKQDRARTGFLSAKPPIHSVHLPNSAIEFISGRLGSKPLRADGGSDSLL